MSATRTIGITGAFVLAIVVVLVGAAVYLADEHSGLLYMLAEDSLDSSSSDSSGMEVQGHWNGIGLAPVDSRRAAEVGVPRGRRKGVAIVHLDPQTGRGAQDAGVRVGDVIVGVDQRPINNLTDLYKRSRAVAPGTPVLLDVQRQGQRMSFAVPMNQANMVQAAMRGPAPTGPQFCPADGILVTAEQAAQNPTCPVCGGPLMQMPRQGVAAR